MRSFGLEWSCRMDFYGCKAVSKLILMLSPLSAVYMVDFPLSEYNPVYQTLHFSDASLMHLQSSSAYSHSLHIGLHMLRNSALPPASALSPLPTIMANIKKQVALLIQQIQVLQTKRSPQTPPPQVALPPPPATTKLLKITMPTPFTGLQDDLDHFKAECSLYICL